MIDKITKLEIESDLVAGYEECVMAINEIIETVNHHTEIIRNNRLADIDEKINILKGLEGIFNLIERQSEIMGFMFEYIKTSNHLTDSTTRDIEKLHEDILKAKQEYT